jgi:FixJ family two-component response regulator
MSVRAMKAGAAEFFTKPVRHEELLAAIQEAVAGRTSRPALN